MRFFKVFLVGCLPCFFSICFAQKIQLVTPELKLVTPWTAQVNPDDPLPEYPRPTMERQEWKSLNGRWHFVKTVKDESMPKVFDREIIVPFPVESALSGIGQSVSPYEMMWYKRTFFIPEDWSGRYILLHFGASDWETTVYINGKEIGKHRGGFDPFSFDISAFLDERGVQEIVVSVWDPTDSYHQPRGKQKIERGKIWYTPVSGIWQSVWLEPVNLSSLASIKLTPDIDRSSLGIQANIYNALPGDSVRAVAVLDGMTVNNTLFAADGTGLLPIKNQKLWSPEHPTLYQLKLELIRKGKSIDAVNSYFGMRKISVQEHKNGHKLLYLNNKPQFQYGLLDQGWWPDGLYTAPTDEALKSDIIRTKNLGYNLIRKHVKVEPERWYMHCDQVGIVVWQDMPNSDKNAPWKGPSGIDGQEIEREFISEAQYKLEFEALVESLYNHPSIVKWIPFNEGWGQFKTHEIYEWVATLDSTRLIGGPSGGNYFPVGDTRDYHRYPGPEMPPKDQDRALILGEFGGLGLPLEGHLWQSEKNWGYETLQKPSELIKKYINLTTALPPLIRQGLAGAIYTQTTDVEGEVNGVMTYDRKVIKLKSKKVKKAHEALFEVFTETLDVK
ncbi:MAG: beta-galactosidase [Cyclobacteriaceae bacterium]|nr:beta-galactosidase [Cyclobacteriaceae bacterium]